jgi:alkanesulfonate monooxygenase SsuD/methylene tetrahydromethanopterin reductase-like flavin-dependent oxidoreductase (luciferase family)
VLRLGYGTYVTAPALLDGELDEVERAGFDSVVFSEHHGMAGYVPDPLTAATYALGRCAALRAGPMPLVLPLHDPIHVAEAGALADAVSGGRLVFGVAAGFLARDFQQRGLAVDERADRLEEATTIVRRLWRGELSAYEGKHYTIPALEPLCPGPVQPGGPPVWMASGTPAGVRRAARVADGIVIDSVRTVSGVCRLVAAYRAATDACGRPAGTIALMRRGWIGTPEETAPFVESVQRQLRGFAEHAAGQPMPWLDEPGGTDLDAVGQRALVGSADDVLAHLRELEHDLGVDYVIVKVQWTTAADPSALRDQLRRWAPLCASFNASAG